MVQQRRKYFSSLVAATSSIFANLAYPASGFIATLGSSTWTGGSWTNGKRLFSTTGLVRSSASDEPEFESESFVDQPKSSLERVALSGVSISSKPGFFVLLESSRGTLPLQLTSDPKDAFATTSPESLTIIQLLSGVDMAGAILPPETLAKLLVLYCESIPEIFLEDRERQVLGDIQTDLPDGTTSFAEAQPWAQSRMKLPQVTLDGLTLSLRTGDYSKMLGDHVGSVQQLIWACELQCNVKSIGRISFTVAPELIQAVSYNYDSNTSLLFTCVALALRYKAPIAVQHSDDITYYSETKVSQKVEKEDASTEMERKDSVPEDEFWSTSSLDDLFPQRTTVAKLQQQSSRVAENIERGFEIHKLTKALEMARKFGDVEAEKKIRAELDQYDSFNDLPTTVPSGSDDVDEKSATFVDEGIVPLDDDDETSFQ